jgi:hypothetical protein
LRFFLSAHIPAAFHLCLNPAPQKSPRISRRLAGKLPLPTALPGLAGISFGLARSPLRGLGVAASKTFVSFTGICYSVVKKPPFRILYIDYFNIYIP